VHAYFDLWAWDGTLERIHEAHYLAASRERRPRGQALECCVRCGGSALVRWGSNWSR